MGGLGSRFIGVMFMRLECEMSGEGNEFENSKNRYDLDEGCVASWRGVLFRTGYPYMRYIKA